MSDQVTTEAATTTAGTGQVAETATGTTTQAGGAPPAQATQPAGKATTTVATTDPSVVDERVTATNFPDDWREQLSGDDKGLLSTLKRYRSPQGLAKAYREAQLKLSRGALEKGEPGEDATDEEKAAWRSQNGIPESPDGYEKAVKLPEGMILSDTDKVLAKGFAEYVHENKWPQRYYDQAMGWYTKFQNDMLAKIQDTDTTHQAEGIRALKEEMGPGDFKMAMNSLDALRRPEIEGDQGTLDELVSSYRGPDGRLLGNDPRFLKMLISLANEIDPAARITPAEGAGFNGKSIKARIDEINAIMGDPVRHVEYDKSPAMQNELAKLIEADLKLARRSAA